MLNHDWVDISLALHCYDPFNADSFEASGDPGIARGKLFHSQCEWFTGRSLTGGYRDIIVLKSDLYCESPFSSKTIRQSIRAVMPIEEVHYV